LVLVDLGPPLTRLVVEVMAGLLLFQELLLAKRPEVAVEIKPVEVMVESVLAAMSMRARRMQ
jgi:hypothetical protein